MELKLKVLTPAGLIAEDQVTGVTLETSTGQITILPAHCQYTAVLGAGELKYNSSSGAGKFYVICGGFVSVENDQVLILADEVLTLEQIDSVASARRLNELEEQLAETNISDSGSDNLLAEIAKHKALLAAAAN